MREEGIPWPTVRDSWQEIAEREIGMHTLQIRCQKAVINEEQPRQLLLSQYLP